MTAETETFSSDVSELGDALINAVEKLVTKKESTGTSVDMSDPVYKSFSANAILADLLKKYDNIDDRVIRQITRLNDLLNDPDARPVAIPWSLFYRSQLMLHPDGNYIFPQEDDRLIKLRGTYFWCEFEVAEEYLGRFRDYFRNLSRDIDSEIYLKNDCRKFWTILVPSDFFKLDEMCGREWIFNFQFETTAELLAKRDACEEREAKTEEELREWCRDHSVQFKRSFRPDLLKPRRGSSKVEEVFNADK